MYSKGPLGLGTRAASMHSSVHVLQILLLKKNLRVKGLKEELAWITDKRLQVISNKMLFKTVLPLRN